MYAAIRQGKAKAGTAEELARTIKEGAIPSRLPSFIRSVRKRQRRAAGLAA